MTSPDQLGYFYALSGRLPEGLPLLEAALAAMEAMTMIQWRTPLIAHVGETLLLAHQPDEARAMAERGLSLSREHGHRGSEAWMWRLQGEIAASGERPDVTTAATHYGAALALASELRMRPLVAHCHLGLGKLSRRTGQREQAREHLTTATTMYREMDMTSWLEQAEAELRSLA